MWVWQRRWTFISRVCCLCCGSTRTSSCDATSARFAFVGEATTVARAGVATTVCSTFEDDETAVVLACDANTVGFVGETAATTMGFGGEVMGVVDFGADVGAVGLGGVVGFGGVVEEGLGGDGATLGLVSTTG